MRVNILWLMISMCFCCCCCNCCWLVYVGDIDKIADRHNSTRWFIYRLYKVLGFWYSWSCSFEPEKSFYQTISMWYTMDKQHYDKHPHLVKCIREKIWCELCERQTETEKETETERQCDRDYVWSEICGWMSVFSLVCACVCLCLCVYITCVWVIIRTTNGKFMVSTSFKNHSEITNNTYVCCYVFFVLFCCCCCVISFPDAHTFATKPIEYKMSIKCCYCAGAMYTLYSIWF